jgi:kumamolisin
MKNAPKKDFDADPIHPNYRRIEGSHRQPLSGASRTGPADPDEILAVTLMVRRRPDGPALPDVEQWQRTSQERRKPLSHDEFVARYGAAQADLDRVVDFARSHGMTVKEADAARRTVIAAGTVAQMNRAFAVDLGRYESTEQSYRGRDGYVHVPEHLAAVIEGVFGLDNRRFGGHNSADPINTVGLTPPEVAALYNFPTGTAAGQTVGIIEVFGGYALSDIQDFYLSLGPPFTMPTLIDVSVGSSNSGFSLDEVVLDITVASSVAQGAAIAVYFATPNQAGWVDAVLRAVHPGAGDPVPSVLSISDYISNGDDAATLAGSGVTPIFLNALHNAFRDAALKGVTVMVASGDTGAQSKVFDGKAHVQYPASDPWVTSCGGTTVGNITASSFDEYVWNDDSGASGGGISDFFPLPAYQVGAGVPASINDGHLGRGVPDIAGNASNNSGYAIFVGGTNIGPGSGTSGVAPLYAGLIALLNAHLGQRVGFINPLLYELRESVCRDIAPPPGPTDNSFGATTGYPAGPGWDACTGWGSIDGKALLGHLRHAFSHHHHHSPAHHAHRVALTGKIGGLVYDRFGDFESFRLDTDHGEHEFHTREKEMETLAESVWRDRIRITVWAARHEPHRPLSIMLHKPPAPF